MARFPALEPYKRSWTLPSFSTTEESGIRFLHSTNATNQRLTLNYVRLTNAEAKLIRDHYREQQGSYRGFLLSDAVRNGYSSMGTLQPQNTLWRYSAVPSETHLDGSFYNVEVELQSCSGANILLMSFPGLFNGAKTSALAFNYGILIGINTTQTWEQHFTANGYTSPSDQVTAGFPYYFMPTQNSGSYEEEFDCGIEIPDSNIFVDISSAAISGDPTLTTTISTKRLAGDPWTAHSSGTTAYATAFRYIKVVLSFSSGGNLGLINVSSFTVNLQA